MKKLHYPFVLLITALVVACGSPQKKSSTNQTIKTAAITITPVSSIVPDSIEIKTIERSDAEWKKILTDKEYNILRERGTEPAFKNEYYDKKTEGVYYCAACGLPLYTSKTKFHSGTGWPSFWDPIDDKLVKRHTDTRFGTKRIEVVCAQCGSHLGHVFEWDTPSGERHCLNSLALDFKEKELKEAGP